MEVLAFLTDEKVVGQILTHLGVPQTLPPLPARLPPQLELPWEDESDDVEEVRSGRATPWPSRSSRGPPRPHQGLDWDQDHAEEQATAAEHPDQSDETNTCDWGA